jgi:DNA polymerase-3 subunit delta'
MMTPLIGHPQAEATLARAVAQERVSHAYLFVGPESVGKHTAALLLAQALNCERGVGRKDPNQHGDTKTWRGHGEDQEGKTEGAEQDPDLPFPLESPRALSVSSCLRVDSLQSCGVCESCRRIVVGTHPDVRVILPGSKTGQNISIEQIREVRQDVARRPIMGRRKIYLIPSAEAMNEEAANALLKTLEEPPADVTLVLMTASPTRVLPTILSRCQIVRFGPAPEGAIREWLAAEGVPADTAAALAVAAGGRPGLARRWSRDPEALERRRQVLELLAEVPRLRRRCRQSPGEAIAALRLAERARSLVGPEDAEMSGPPAERSAAARGTTGKRARKGAEAAGDEAPGSTADPVAGAQPGETTSRAAAKPSLLRLLDGVRSYYRDVLLLAHGAPEELLWNADALLALREAAADGSAPAAVAALAAVDRCQQFLERNVAPQLAFETLFLELLRDG